MMVVEAPIHRVRVGPSIRMVRTPRVRTRPLRLARMLAVAHVLSRELADRDEVARALGCTHARVSQLFDLLLLAPDIQEEIVFMVVTTGRDPVTEHSVRRVVRALDWEEQRRRWRDITGPT